MIKKVKMLICAIVLVQSSIALAETKQLICTTTAESEAARWDKTANDDWYKKNMPDYIEEWKQNAKICRNTGKFGWKVTVTFDTQGLKNPQFSMAEQARESCAGYGGSVVEVKLSATPSIISFKGDKVFNVDRKNLKAGFGTERNHTCILQDVDISENIL